MDKISYALGLSMGQNLMGSGVESLNYQDLAQGIEDVLTKQQPKSRNQNRSNRKKSFRRMPLSTAKRSMTSAKLSRWAIVSSISVSYSARMRN